MANEIVSGNGGIAPYTPASGGLPASADLGTSVDYLTDHSGATGSPTLFGHPLPAGATEDHAELAIMQIVTVFKGDAKKLGISTGFINQAANWFKQAALNPVNEPGQHSYDLSNLTLPPGDIGLINAFCNWAQTVGASEEDVRRSLYWYSLLAAKVANPQAPTQAQNQTLPGKQIEKVSESEYRSIIRNQDQAIINCEEKLKEIWRQNYRRNLNVAIDYFRHQLTPEEQDHLQSTVVGNVMALNNPQVIERMYQLATSSGQSQPGSLVEINRQISEIEKIMGTKKYRADNEMQSRYRQLVDQRLALGG